MREDRQTDTLIAILCFPAGDRVKIATKALPSLDSVACNPFISRG